MSTIAVSNDQRPDGWSDGAAAYDEWFAPVSSRFAVNALRLLGLEPGQRLLDVAAGTGALTLQAAAAGLHVVAVDFAPGMVGILRRRLGDAGLRADVEQMDFKWLAAEEEIPDPMAGMRPPHVPDKPVPVFSGDDLSRLERACAGRSFQQRRDAAVIAVFRATGIRLSELAGIRYDPDDPQRGDIDVQLREITVHGKGRKTRTVKISFGAARSLDRYLRVRARHAQAYRPQLWLGVGNRGPMTASGIYQMIARRGRECGIDVFPHRFRHHFSHTWLDCGGPEGDLMELNGWTSPQMLRRYGASARSARARRTYDRIMEDSP